MLPAQDLIAIMCPSLSAVFVGFLLLLTMAWVIHWGEQLQEERRNAGAQDEEPVPIVDAVIGDSDVEELEDDDSAMAFEPTAFEPTAFEPTAFESLYKTVQEEKANSNRMQQTLYQLLGGLFNHETQNKTMMYDVRHLLNETVEDCGECPYETQEDTLQRQTEHIYPTTRQGDESATKIAQMEETLAEAVRSIEMLQKELKDEKERNVNRASDTNEVFMRLGDLESSDIDHELMLKLIMGGEYRSQNQKPLQQQQPLQPWYGDEE